MQGKADETERPRNWPGATVGSESLTGNPEFLWRRLVLNKHAVRSNVPAGSRPCPTDARLEELN